MQKKVLYRGKNKLAVAKGLNSYLKSKYPFEIMNDSTHPEAMALAKRSYKVFKQLKNHERAVYSFFLVAKIEFDTFQMAEAKRHLEQALKLAQRFGTITSLGLIYYYLGLYYTTVDISKGVHYFSLAEQSFSVTSNSFGQAGAILMQLFMTSKSLIRERTLLREKLNKMLTEPVEEKELLYAFAEIARAEDLLYHFKADEALVIIEKNLPVVSHAGQFVGLSCLLLLAYAYILKENLAEAMDILSPLGSGKDIPPPVKAAACKYTGLCYLYGGSYQEAIRFINKADKMFKITQNRYEQLENLYNLSVCYLETARYEEALSLLDQVEKAAAELCPEDRQLPVQINYSKAALFAFTTNRQEAFYYWQKASTALQDCENDYLKGLMLVLPGFFLNRDREGNEIIRCCKEAAALFTQTKNTARLTGVYLMIALQYQYDGKFNRSKVYLDKVATNLKQDKSANPAVLSLTNILLAQYYLQEGEPEIALPLLDRARSLGQRVQNRQIELMAVFVKGLTLLNNDRQQAKLLLIETANLYESLRSGLKTDLLLMRLGNQLGQVYMLLFHIYIDEGNLPEAFNMAERFRARSFINWLVSDLGRDNPQWLKLCNLRDALAGLDSAVLFQRAGGGAATSMINSGTVRTELEMEYRQCFLRLQISSRSLHQVASVGIHPIDQVLQHLGNSRTMVNYVIFEDLTALIIDQASGLRAVKLPGALERIKEIYPAYSGYLADAMRGDFDQVEQVKELFYELYQIFFAPVERHIAGNDLVIVPHQVLHYVPFAALYDGDKYLTQRLNICLAPSASAFCHTAEKGSVPLKRALLLDFPGTESEVRLKMSKTEVHNIKKSLAGRVEADIVSERVPDWQSFLESAEKYQLFHFACHGEFNLQDPLLSSLHLADASGARKKLGIPEILKMNLENTELVTLAACESGLSDPAYLYTNELNGLLQPFFLAGASSVLSTLWPVDDRATAIFMQHFYNLYVQEGYSKSSACCQAAMLLQNQPGYEHPFYWAPFVLWGNPE